MQIALATSTSMVLYIPNELDDMFIEHTLKQDLEEVTRQLSNLEAFCTKVRAELNVEDMDLTEELNRLNAIAEDIETTSDNFEYMKDADEDLEEDGYGFADEADEDEIEQEAAAAIKAWEAFYRELKMIYRRICAICHPDKTTNKHYIKMFAVAQEAYNTDNLEELREIYDTLVKSDSKIKSIRNRARQSIDLRIALLEKKIQDKSDEITKIMDEPNFIIYETYRQHGFDVARKFRKRLLLDSIEQLRAKLKINGIDF